MKRYWLHRHTYVCMSGDIAVWLDLQRDKYFGTSCADLLRLGALIEGFDQSGSPTADDQKFAEELHSRGVLTADAMFGKAGSLLEIEVPDSSLVDEEGTGEPGLRLHHVWYFLRAVVVAFVHLRVRSLCYAVESVEAMKKAHGREWTEADTSDVRELVRIFQRLRPFFYTVKLACLLDSVTLVRFLAPYGVYPLLTIGVATQPFHAHCWVQDRDFIFNSEPTFTQQFKPILAV